MLPYRKNWMEAVAGGVVGAAVEAAVGGALGAAEAGDLRHG